MAASSAMTNPVLSREVFSSSPSPPPPLHAHYHFYLQKQTRLRWCNQSDLHHLLLHYGLHKPRRHSISTSANFGMRRRNWLTTRRGCFRHSQLQLLDLFNWRSQNPPNHAFYIQFWRVGGRRFFLHYQEHIMNDLGGETDLIFFYHVCIIIIMA